MLTGLILVYFGTWLIFSEIIPQIIESGWSLQGSNMVLNHDWRGNQLYLLVAIYGGVGVGLMLLGRLVFLSKTDDKPSAQVRVIR